MRSYYVKRDKFFYASPKLFPEWPYRSRLAIGMRFDDFRGIYSDFYRFEINGVFYEIDREKALYFGNQFILPFGKLPNLIPKEEFREIKKEVLQPVEKQGMLF